MSSNKNNEKKEIISSLILEVLGKPPEHLKDTLKKIIEKLSNEKDVEVIEKKINEAAELKKKKGFYTNFAEIELKTKTFRGLLGIVFKYMPAHVEIVSPEKVSFTNNEAGEMINELSRRLHGYDEVARVMKVEKNVLEKKLKNILENQKDSKSEKSGSSDKKENIPEKDLEKTKESSKSSN